MRKPPKREEVGGEGEATSSYTRQIPEKESDQREATVGRKGESRVHENTGQL